MNFSDQEKELIYYYANRKEIGHEYLHYFVVLFTVASFGVYGMIKSDVQLVSMSLVAVFMYTIWLISSGSKYYSAHRSLFSKVATLISDPDKIKDLK